ncbi:hypothetical protein CRYUN_Cryun15aG0060700 [Craigia yunnanensis]
MAKTGASWRLMGHDGKRRGYGEVKVVMGDFAFINSLVNDYYVVLGLLSDATLEKKKMGYYNFMKVCHPELSGNDLETTNFCMFINEVYRILSDLIQHSV